MAKKDGGWQPLLLDPNPKAPDAAPPETRVEYDPAPKRRREAEFQRDAGDDAPWWGKVRQVTQEPKRPDPPASWGQLWLRLLRAEGWTVDLPPSKRALLEAAVRGIEARHGAIEAGVSPGRERPQRVQLRLVPLTSAEWARVARQVVDTGAAEAVQSALEAGALPIELVEAADAHKLALVPRKLSGVSATCTCGGARLPCEHVLAVHLSLSRKLEREPLTLVAALGMTLAEWAALVARVRERVRDDTKVDEAADSDVDPFAFRGPAPELSTLDAPPTPRAPLPSPDGWRARESFDALVRRILAAARSS